MFSSSRKLVLGSAGPYILGESGVISVSLIKDFLKGKMHNRCQCGHL